MEKLLEILREHKDKISYTLTFGKPEILTIRFKDGSVIRLCEHIEKKSEK
jgi:hypothetical protein